MRASAYLAPPCGVTNARSTIVRMRFLPSSVRSAGPADWTATPQC